MPAPPGRACQAGFGILAALLCVALIAIYLMEAGTIWSLQVQRSREAQLLRSGDAIRKAIGRYALADGGGTYPQRLEDLLVDPRVPYPRHHLRALYPDPMTGGEWLLIKGVDGEIYGVQSAATGEPLKQHGFPPEYASFAMKQSYQEWKFAHYPSAGRMRR
ncbi:MAG TPA: type II secretion system protein [Lysobacter sp.]